MKTGLFLAALVQLAAAQPHRYNKRAVVTQIVTATAPDAVVWVNPDGTPVSTSFASNYAAKPTPVHQTSVLTAAAVPAPSAPAPVVHHHIHHKHQHGHTKHKNAGLSVENAPAPPAPAPVKHHRHHHHKAAAGSSGSSSADSNLGIAWTPYTDGGACKTQGEVDSDFNTIGSYKLVRIYGTDCNQLQMVKSAASAKGMKVMLGAFNYPPTDDIQKIISAFQGDWGMVDTVSVGNELVAQGRASADDVVGYIYSARTSLRNAGFGGPVVANDVFNTITQYPQLCKASDYAAANAHAFFDATCVASNAGKWAQEKVADLKKACPGKDVIITESGWPSQGSTNGAAIPGESEQQAAISSLRSSFASGGLVLFTAFNDMWKQNSADTFNAEQFWGIYPGQ